MLSLDVRGRGAPAQAPRRRRRRSMSKSLSSSIVVREPGEPAVTIRSGSNANSRRRSRRRRGGQNGLTTTTISAPATATAISVRKNSNATHLERFSDYVGSLNFPTSTAAGDLVLNVVETLDNFGARMRVLAGLYQRWRFRSLAFRYISEVPTSVAGSITMAHIDDASYTLSGALGLTTEPGSTWSAAQVALLRSIVAEADGAVTFPVWSPQIRMPVRCKKEWMYCNSINVGSVLANMNANGVLLALSNSAYSGTTPCGRVFAEGVVEFDKPAYNVAAQFAQTATFTVSAVGDATAGDALRFNVISSSGQTLTDPNLIWIPSQNIQVGGSGGTKYVKYNVPQFLVFNPSAGNYFLYSSIIDVQTGTPEVSQGAVSSGGIDPAATIYVTPAFS